MRNDEANLFSYLLSKLRAEAESITQHLAGGGMKDHSEYRYNVGRLNGLTTAIELIKTTAKHYDEDS